MAMATVTWEGINVGDEIPPLAKKPSYMQLFMFSAVCWNRHLIHYNPDYARSDGLKDAAPQRALIGSFLAQLLSSWVGDAGRVTLLEWSVRASALPGQVITCKGKVIEKRLEGDRQAVECSLWAEDAEGLVLAPGRGVVALFD